ncbi:hypothetical protein MASR2M47_10870 [Draconibacterium sp.]|jgi:hypothetical protein
MKKYILNLFVVLIVVALIGWLVFSKIIPQYYLPVFPFLVLFFAVVSVSIHYYQLQLAKKDTAIFTRSIMLITFLKLILYSAVAIIYIAIDRENAKIFVVHFLSLYVIFIVFDVFSLLRITANSKKQG